MTDEQFAARFRTVADHLESLATSIQSVEELEAQDRLRLEQDSLRIDRLERLFKLMMRIGDRERKDLRERINALIDAQIHSEVKMGQLSEAQKRSEEAAAQFQLQVGQFQTQVGQLLSTLTDATALAHRRLDAIESNGHT